MFDLQGTATIVTGGGHGIGAAVCKTIAECGGDVVVADLDQEAAARVAEDVKTVGTEALDVRVDVTDAASVKAMVEAGVERFPRLDGLVNNAGTWLRPVTIGFKPFEEITQEEWDWVMAVNARGIFHTCQAIVPHLKGLGGGKIVNMSSATVYLGTPGLAQYVASKAAALGFTRSLANEVGEFGIRVNAVNPGLILTEDDPSEEVLAHHRNVAEQHALRKIGYPEYVAGPIAFFLSDASTYITGQSLVIDGGIITH